MLRQARAGRASAGAAKTASRRVGDSRYQLLAAQTTDAVFLLAGRSLQVMEANQAALVLTGYAREELIGLPVAELIPAKDRSRDLARISSARSQTSTVTLAEVLRKDQSVTQVEVREQRLEDDSILGVLRPTGGLRQAQGHLRQMLGGIELLAATVDLDGQIAYANPVLALLMGCGPDDLTGRPVGEVIRLDPDSAGRSPVDRLAEATLQKPVNAELVTATGSRPVAISASPLRDDAGRPVGLALLGQDLAQERSSFTELQGQLQERAEVAGALGRLHLGETVAETAANICRELRGLSGVDISALILFDSQAGATVISYEASRQIALSGGPRLPRSRAAYLAERARGGPWSEPWMARDEDGAYGRELEAAHLSRASYAPLRHQDEVIGLLVVVSLGDQDGSGAGPGRRLPVIAEFGAAASALFAQQLEADRARERVRCRLLDIVDRGAWHPVFQPIVDLASGTVVGYEALTRFDDGEPPDTMFATAWDAGLGWELELAAVKQALSAARSLPKGRWLDLNVSPRLLEEPERLRRALRSSGRQLVLEVTEHEVIRDYPAARAALAKLGDVLTAVDDAGAGTANFAHVIELQPDFVKLDIGMVRGIDKDLGRQAMVVAMRHFAQATGCRLIAEGVETRGEAATIKALGPEFGQGYWYGRPQTVARLQGQQARGRRPEQLGSGGRSAA
ncbi:MAG TPA: EAL domain-containing protein [Candidatus Dormibacteraeota bacterium]